MDTVCEICGDIGFKRLLVCCRDCKCSSAHQYCLDEVVFDASLAEWLCYECLQRHGEVSCRRSLENLSSARLPSHVLFESTVHQPITKRVESARDLGPWRNRKSKPHMKKYASLNKIYPSQKKHFKRKSNMPSMGNCTIRKERISTGNTRACAKTLNSCETIGRETAKSNNGENQKVDNENSFALNIKQPSHLIVNCLGYTLGDTNQPHLLEAMEGLACKLEKAPRSLAAPLKGLVMKTKNVALGSNKSNSSRPTSEHGNSVIEKSGDESNRVKDSCANVSSKHISHEIQTNQHASVGCKNTEDNRSVVGAHQNKYWAAASLRNSKGKSEAHGDSTSNVIDGFTLEREREEVRFQLDYSASNELPQRSVYINVPQLSTLENNVVDKVMLYSANNGRERVLPYAGIRSTPSVRERNVDSVHISSSSQHDNTESSESGKIFVECQKVNSCHHGKNLKTAATSLSSEESGGHIPSENEYLELDDLQATPEGDYVLSRTSCLSKAQKERVMAFIQETQPEITPFVTVMRKSNVQPPGPCLGISKEYAFAHFPHETTNVTLQRPGERKMWHAIFYKRNESRKNMLMGQWLDFVRDNHVQEGDICLLVPTKGGRRSKFMVYLLRAAATHSQTGASSQMVGPCSGRSIAEMASEVYIKEKPTHEERVSLESGMHEISPKSLESEGSGDPFQLPYIVPCRNALSKSQKKIVEERVQAIQADVPICVAIMKNNNVGVAQRWMLELGKRYASEYLPARGQTVVLQCMGKIWEVQMMIHNGRRWFLNGGWPKFARDNGLRVGDICLFELKENEMKLTMRVHIIYREQF